MQAEYKSSSNCNNLNHFQTQYTPPNVRPQFIPGAQYMQSTGQAPQQHIFFQAGMPPMAHGQHAFTFAQPHPGFHPGQMPIFAQPHMAQMQQQQQQPAGQPPTGQSRSIPTATPTSQGQPPLTIAPHNMGLPPNPLIAANQIMFPPHQIPQPSQPRPPLPRPRSKAIKIVDPTTQCEIDLSADKTVTAESPAKASTPEESGSEVKLTFMDFLQRWGG